jgi:hypothetical protein
MSNFRKSIFILLTLTCLSACTHFKGRAPGASDDDTPRSPPESLYKEKEELGEVHVTFYKTVDQKVYPCDEPTKSIRVLPETKNAKEREAGTKTIKVCPGFFKVLLMEGAGVIHDLDEAGTLINYVNEHEPTGHSNFVIVDRCRYGLGVKNSCLIPFFTMAADLDAEKGGYKFGDIIYFPLLKGTVMESGERHPGLIVVRDTGNAFKGKKRNRGDLYIGVRQDLFNHFFTRNGILSDGKYEAFLLKGDSRILAEEWFKANYPKSF